eukprot:GILK01002550.1.p1 GENE.GILK01002550.1~~GILK01002550.1.p1  ORF type:complete len:575 (+),score=100.97 GILK01002550.1:63-1727(+)
MAERKGSGEDGGQKQRLLDRRTNGVTPSSKSRDATPIRERVTLNDLSYPPTSEELANYVDVHPSQLPSKYKRDMKSRVFVNRDLRLDKIRWYGFDMDYTLAEYKAPACEGLAYSLCIDYLVSQGYPEGIKSMNYDESFPQRGLILDRKLGHLIKLDAFGFILACVHGRNKVEKKGITSAYPSRIVREDEIGKGRRFFSLDTPYSMPEACVYADLVHFLENAEDHEFDEFSYAALFQDVREAFDHVHLAGQMKQTILDNPVTYINKDPKLAELLKFIRIRGSKIFLLTNSDYKYTNIIMTYLLQHAYTEEFPSWIHFFDVVICGAVKPLFFREGTNLREVALDTGALKLTNVVQNFKRGNVYHGGSLEKFSKLVGGLSGGDVLYVGDHIYGDILIPKKSHCWRTLLIIRELEQELEVWATMKSKYTHLVNLEWIRAEMFRDMDVNDEVPPDVTDLHKHIRRCVDSMDNLYNRYFGSMFRSGSKQTFFSMQVQRYADLYSCRAVNLFNYPSFYFFAALDRPMAHEMDFVNQRPRHTESPDDTDDYDPNFKLTVARS